MSNTCGNQTYLSYIPLSLSHTCTLMDLLCACCSLGETQLSTLYRVICVGLCHFIPSSPGNGDLSGP